MRHDLTSLRVFVTVADCGNLTRAAEREHLAVSAISKRIAELEAAIGTPLLQRQPRGVTLTPAGQSLLHYARRVGGLMQEMDDELRGYGQGIKGHVRLHAVASALVQYLPAAIEAFLSLYPQVQISLQEQTGKAIVRAVSEGLADLGVISNLTPAQGLAAVPYHRDRVVLAVPAGHPLARRRAVHFREALAFDVVGPHADSSLAALLHEGAREAGLPLRQRVQASSFDAICRLVECRLGISMLPEGAVAPHREAGRIRAVPLKDAWAERELRVVVRDLGQISHITRTLIDHLQRFAQAAAAPAG